LGKELRRKRKPWERKFFASLLLKGCWERKNKFRIKKASQKPFFRKEK
jgi:hypothetical protein